MLPLLARYAAAVLLGTLATLISSYPTGIAVAIAVLARLETIIAWSTAAKYAMCCFPLPCDRLTPL